MSKTSFITVALTKGHLNYHRDLSNYAILLICIYEMNLIFGMFIES